MKNINELKLILFHVFLGLLVFMIPFSSKLYNLLVIFICFSFVFRSKDKTFAILVSSIYIATSDVFFRMTGGLFFYELHKYLLIIFALLGVLIDTSRSKGYIYIFSTALLLVSIFFTEYSLEENTRKMILFNLSGPISLGFFAFYCYKKRISNNQLTKILFYGMLPIISMLVYMFLYTPDLKSVITGTASNSQASGGFGPNQVSTVLGAGIFILISRLILVRNGKLQFVIEFILLSLFAFRGLATFSRGGILTALLATFFLLIILFLKGNRSLVKKVNKMLFLICIAGVGVWFYTVSQTSGLIENRYLNKNAAGIEKEDVTTGRKDLILLELQAFIENPILGIGVGKNKMYRFNRSGVLAASHNELSRILAEHGVFGIISFLILFFTPLLLRLQFRSNIYFYSFFLFWLLTISHSAMRIAFPSFIYGLTLLNIRFEKKLKPSDRKINAA